MGHALWTLYVQHCPEVDHQLPFTWPQSPCFYEGCGSWLPALEESENLFLESRAEGAPPPALADRAAGRDCPGPSGALMGDATDKRERSARVQSRGTVVHGLQYPPSGLLRAGLVLTRSWTGPVVAGSPPVPASRVSKPHEGWGAVRIRLSPSHPVRTGSLPCLWVQVPVPSPPLPGIGPCSDLHVNYSCCCSSCSHCHPIVPLGSLMRSSGQPTCALALRSLGLGALACGLTLCSSRMPGGCPFHALPRHLLELLCDLGQSLKPF